MDAETGGAKGGKRPGIPLKYDTHRPQNLKQEEWDEKMKLSNQYRGLDAEEHRFLADRAAAQREKERKIKEEEQRELLNYRE